MKNFFILLLITISFTNCSNDDDVQTSSNDDNVENPIEPENIFVGDVLIINQQELDDFVLNDYTKVDGFLKISGVNDLSGLSYLNEVTGDFSIGSLASSSNSNPDLSNLNGIENLKQVGGNLNILSNDLIEEINQLYNLEYVGGRVSITGNNELTQLNNFNKLLSIGGVQGIYIKSNDKLKSIDFPVVETINKFYITENDLLESISFQNLISVNDEFKITTNYAVTDLNFSSLETLSNVWIFNTNISDFNGFPNLNSISGRFVLRLCNNLTNYCEISDVTFSDPDYISILACAYNPTNDQLFSSTQCSI